MSKHQKTFTVEHPGAYNPTRQALVGALDASLRAEGIERQGEFKVLSSVSVGGKETKYTVEFEDGDAEQPDDEMEFVEVAESERPIPVKKTRAKK